MPNIKSAEKRMRQNEKRRMVNRRNLGRMRTEIKRFRLLVSTEKIEEARQFLPQVYSAIDRSVTKGVIHRNTAARYKSRLSRHLNRALSS